MGFRNKLKEYRKKCGMTQKDLAVKSNVSRATIAGLESGAISVTTTDTLLKLSRALQAPVTSVFFTK